MMMSGYFSEITGNEIVLLHEFGFFDGFSMVGHFSLGVEDCHADKVDVAVFCR